MSANKKIDTKLKGEEITLCALAKRFNLDPGTVHSRWRAAGRPTDIPESMVRPAIIQVKPLITLDGHRVSIRYLSKRFGIQEESVRRKMAKHGRALTSELFFIKPTVDAPARRYQHPEDRSPGWLEKREFPNAGNNGFCKVEVSNFSGISESGVPLYTGGRS